MVNAKAGTVTFKKMVLTPIEIYKEIQMLKYEAKYSQYGGSSSGEDFWQLSDSEWMKQFNKS